MEKVFELRLNKTSWNVDISEHQFYHREHAYCEVCGSKMQFRITPREKPYSGWTRNLVFEVREVCREGCENFLVMEIYQNDGKLYTSNFEKLEEKIAYMLEKGDVKWTK
jgi:hypothetical protein